MNSTDLGGARPAGLPAAPQQTRQSSGQLREQAIALRRAGHSRREIKQILGIGSNQTLNEALRGEPPPERTRRARAKDDLRARARELRTQGLDYEEIAGRLSVSKSSVSLWVRDMPWPERLSYEECRKRSVEGSRAFWATERPAREAKREEARAAACAEIGELSRRDILIAGAIAYWCEGSKSKPHQLRERVLFINSDPGLIKFFLRFLAAAGVQPTQMRFRVYIHETADVAAAEEFWARITNTEPRTFYKIVFKRHSPKTVRKNVDTEYHGCLRIDVLQSADLYRKIEGWVRSALAPGPVSWDGRTRAALQASGDGPA
jgi:transcriptional regulator with XRE-family HTH domain